MVARRFVSSVVEVSKQLRQGHALGDRPVDCGAMCMPGLAEKVAQLVEEAVQQGAKVISAALLMAAIGWRRELMCAQVAALQFSCFTSRAGSSQVTQKAEPRIPCRHLAANPGRMSGNKQTCAGSDDITFHRYTLIVVQVLTGGKLMQQHEAGGQFYAPTVLVDVTTGMRIWREEVFGPVMVIVRCSSDDEAVRLANDCPFGLGSAVFSRSAARAASVGRRLEVRAAGG